VELLQDAHFWVAVGLAIFVVVLIYVKVPAMAMTALDARGLQIQAELDQAHKLREEAEALLASIKTQAADAERMAAEMMANAETEAKRYQIEAQAKLEEQITRRAALAERKIATAEAAATAEVKSAAAEMAAQTAEAILTGRVGQAKSDPLVDRAIEQLAGKFQ
jgi:F-type H+-transporting ATPase subunit b